METTNRQADYRKLKYSFDVIKLEMKEKVKDVPSASGRVYSKFLLKSAIC